MYWACYDVLLEDRYASIHNAIGTCDLGGKCTTIAISLHTQVPTRKGHSKGSPRNVWGVVTTLS